MILTWREEEENENKKEKTISRSWNWEAGELDQVSGGDGQLFSLSPTSNAEHWWDLCPNITDICNELQVRPPSKTEIQPEKTRQ